MHTLGQEQDHQPSGTIYSLALTVELDRVRYVGQTINLERRIKDHKASSKTPKTAVSHWIAKHGWDNISLCILEDCAQADLDSREDFWISSLGTAKRLGSGGLNIIESNGSPRTYVRGSSAKLTEMQVLEVRRIFFTTRRSCTDISKDYGVSKTAIVDVIRRYTWASLPKSQEEEASTRVLAFNQPFLTQEESVIIYKRHMTGEKQNDLCKEFNVGKTAIRNAVIRGRESISECPKILSQTVYLSSY